MSAETKQINLVLLAYSSTTVSIRRTCTVQQVQTDRAQEQRVAKATAAAKLAKRNRKRALRNSEQSPDKQEESAFASKVDEENERVALWNRYTRQILLMSSAARETTYVPSIKAIWVRILS